MLVSDCTTATIGGPYFRDHEKDTGRVLKRAEAKTGPTEWPPDKRELGGVDRTRIQGLFQLSLAPLLSPHTIV